MPGFICILLWFNPKWQLSPPQPLTCSHMMGWGGEVRKVVGWDKDSSVGEIWENQTRAFIPHFLRAGRCAAISRKARLCRMQRWLEKANSTASNTLLFLLVPPALGAEPDALWAGISQQDSAVLSLPVCPQPHRWWGRMRSRKGLGPVCALPRDKESIPEVKENIPEVKESIPGLSALAPLKNTKHNPYCEKSWLYPSQNWDTPGHCFLLLSDPF